MDVAIFYNQTGSGLQTKDDDLAVRGFAIADSEGNLSWADATYLGDTVFVLSNTGSVPSIIRYAWDYNPENLNLYNKEILPAAPFMIYVNDPGFKISYFNVSETTIERGQSSESDV